MQSAVWLCCDGANCHTELNVTNRSTGGPGSNFDYPQNGLSWVYSACPCRRWRVSYRATIVRLHVSPNFRSMLSWDFTQNTLILCYRRFGKPCRSGPTGCPETAVTNCQYASDLRLPARIAEHCTVLGYCAAGSGGLLPTFRDNLSVPSSGAKYLFYRGAEKSLARPGRK